MLEPRKNPLLSGDAIQPEAELTNFASPVVHRRALVARAEIRDARRAKNAADAIGEIDRETEIYGFTKGQFSIIDVIQHCLNFTGPAAMGIFTWTAAGKDISTVLDLLNSGNITSARWLVDLTFNRRSPELAHRIRLAFGDDAIRVAQNHAKFVLLGNDSWKLVIRTSMNLNTNPRFENFQLAHDPELYAFHEAIFDEIWTKQRRALQDTPRAYDIQRHFNTDL